MSVQHVDRGRIWVSDTPSLRSVLFGAFYIYSPRGSGPVCEVSRHICRQLKLGEAAWLANYARRVREELIRHEALAGLFDPETCLVPVPGSASRSDSIWAAERLATALHGVGLGKRVWPGLHRHHVVPKSATALSGHRPTVRRHYDSLSVMHSSPAPSRLLLIDDVITRGRTILAAAIRLHEALPNADIRAFALVRTMGLLPDVTHFLEPCQGVVRWAGGDARREP